METIPLPDSPYLARATCRYCNETTGGIVVTDDCHDDDCEGWLPEGVCTCVPWIIVAPTAQRAIAHLRRVPIRRDDPDFRRRAVIIYNAHSTERLRGVRNDGGWHLELLDYPTRPGDREAIWHALRIAGWPEEELL